METCGRNLLVVAGNSYNLMIVMRIVVAIVRMVVVVILEAKVVIVVITVVLVILLVIMISRLAFGVRLAVSD